MHSKKKIIGIIPARYASSRFPGKPLALINGKPMIIHTYQNSLKSKLMDKVIVATDDERIRDTIRSMNGEAVMTPDYFETGTDRIAYVIKDMNADIIVNIQGDEPFIKAEAIDLAIRPVIEDESIAVCTLIKKIISFEELCNDNINKVVIDNNFFALYFSHTIIPFIRDEKNTAQWIKKHNFYKHIGLYVYKKDFLLKYSSWPKSRLESCEKLEQLRILENGYKIKCVETDYENISVDTPEDLNRINYNLNKKMG